MEIMENSPSRGAQAAGSFGEDARDFSAIIPQPFLFNDGTIARNVRKMDLESLPFQLLGKQ